MEDNTTLINRIKNSGLNAWQQKNLIELLPNMNDEQKKEMMGLLQKAFEIKGEKMAHVNKYKTIIKDYEGIIKNNQHQLIHYAQGEVQKLDEEKSGLELEELENAIQTL